MRTSDRSPSPARACKLPPFGIADGTSRLPSLRQPFWRPLAMVVGALILGGCGRSADTPGNASGAAVAQAPGDALIACATGGAATMTRTCTVDRETSARGTTLTLHHADGGFHRLLVTTDGHGVIAADGAQGAKVIVTGPDEIEVDIAGDRYRLPATVKRPA